MDQRLKEAQTKASVLTEALPYIRTWNGATVVIKVGGEVLSDPAVLDAVMGDVVLLRFVGLAPVIVHGAGPQITSAMQARGRAATFVAGQRVTDAETVEVVAEVLMAVNDQIVQAIHRHGGQGAAVSGEGVLAVRPAGGELGFVGEVEYVETEGLKRAIAAELVPVLAPLGSGPGGRYNINADLAAASVAAALGAQKVVFLTNVPGLYADLGDAGSLISEITLDRLEQLLGGEKLSAGMIPKIAGALSAMRAGVPQAHLLDGRVLHCLLLEIFTDRGVGTLVLR